MKTDNTLIYENKYFVVEPCHSCPLPGYLIVQSKTPVTSISALPPDSSTQLGVTLQLVVRAVETVLHPIKVYVAQFGEEDGKLHFHVFPRTKWLTEIYLKEFPVQKSLIHGPLFLDWARDKYRKPMLNDETFQVIEKIRIFLNNEA
jgi:diadenosine tetraphosphate (Ap4A) HIT family hydrolase